MKKLIEKNIKVIVYLKEFINNQIKNPCFYVPSFFCVFIAYSFNLFNRSVSVDDMAQIMYYGDQALKVKGFRWGEVFFSRIFSTINYTPFINKFFGLIFFVLTTFLFLSIVYYFDKNKDNIWKYAVVACIFITYPLINEFWEYDTSLYTPLELFILEYGLLFHIINNSDINVYSYLFLGLLFSPVMAGYESPIFAYVSLVFLVLLLEYGYYGIKGRGWFKEGFSYAIPLLISFVFKYVIGYVVVFVNGYTRGDSYGADQINWLININTAITQLAFNAWYYGIRALSYLPITEFIIATIIFVILAIKNRKKKNIVLLSILYFVSLFFLPILQGANFGYRTAQTIQYFVAFVAYLLLLEFNNKKVKTVIIILLMFVGLRQSICLHQLLALNNQRSDNELAVVRNIGYELYSKHDISKEIYFVGKYDIGDNIKSQIYVDEDSFAGKVESYLRNKFGYDGEEYNIPMVSTNVSSCFNWAINAPWYETIKNYFSYCGYDLNINIEATSEDIEKYYQEALDNNLKPLEIYETDSYIIVYMG